MRLNDNGFKIKAMISGLNRRSMPYRHMLPVNMEFTLIKFLIIKTCQIYNLFPYTALREREGVGGEKAATCAASLPVPTNLNISLILRKLSRLCQCSASGKSEQKREVAFPQTKDRC